MKRQEYHFPFPKRERSTQLSSSNGNSASVYFLEVNRVSVPAPVFYRRSLPKKDESNGELKERHSLVVERDPNVDFNEGGISVLQDVAKREIKEQKPLTKLVLKKREVKVREIRPFSQPIDNVVEHDELPQSPCYRISVVIGFRGRDQDRLDGLKKCIKSLREQTLDCYIILVEQDTIPVHQDELEPLVDSYLFTYSSALFNRSWAFNCGAMIAPDDLVLLHDCDLMAPKNYLKESVKIIGSRDAALPWAKILYLTEDSSKTYPIGNPKVSSVLTNHQVVGGSILVRKSFYLRIGGMDERFEGWGCEDNAFHAKVAKIGRLNRANVMSGVNLLHYYHKPALKSHTHSASNYKLQGEYFRMSYADFRGQVDQMQFIGNPLKYEPVDMMKRVSFVLGFRGPERLIGLKKSIESIRKQKVPSYIILVEQDSSPLFREEVEPLVDKYLFTYSNALFNKSWAFNCAVLEAPDELIMLHDVDVMLPDNYIRDAITLLESADLALPWARALFLDEESTQRFPIGPMKTKLVADNSWSCGLSLLVRRSFYLRIGGMDERFEGWGEEDKAFFEKACQLGKVKKASLTNGPTIFHHYHKEAPSVHGHTKANKSIYEQYHNKSDADMRDMIKELGQIGNRSKYSESEKANP